MLSVTINEQVFCAGQYTLAKAAENTGTTVTAAPPPVLIRLAKLWHFAIHSVNINESTKITHGFAIVTWPMTHPDHNALGKPFEVWCLNLFDSNSSLPEIIPLECVCSLLLTKTTVLHRENVLSIPLV